MLSANLQNILDDPDIAKDVFVQMGLRQFDRAHRSLLSIAENGVPLDLLEDIVVLLTQQLPAKPDPDLGLSNLERFIVSSRSPMSFAALIVRDPSALSSLLDIFSFSELLSELLIQDPESFDLIRLTEGQPVAKETLIQELRCDLDMATGRRAVKNLLRNFKHREVLRIAYGDVVRKFDVDRTSQQLAFLADSICTVAFEYCLQSTLKKRGEALSPSEGWESLPISIVCSGALGANGFDYGSAIQLTVLVDASNNSNSRELEFASKVIADFEEMLTEENELGSCYQVDFETRPSNGTSKVLPLGEAKKYFDQNASAQDRLNFTKIRHLCGQPRMSDSFLASLNALTFRSYFGRNDIAELRSLRRGISNLDSDVSGFRNVKKSPGGIHDLEFTIAYLQLLVGKKVPSAQSGDFAFVLHELEKNEVLTQQERSLLKDNYAFLKMLSFRLQVYSQNRSELLPSNERALSRLQKHIQNHLDLEEGFCLESHLATLANENLKVMSHLLQGTKESDGIFEDLVLGAETSQAKVIEELGRLGFESPANACKLIQNLATEKHRFISSKRCRYFLSSIVASLIDKISKSPDPDETLTSLDLVSDSLGGKGTLWELCQLNESCLDLYVNLCSKAPYLTSLLRSNPGMLDELMDSLVHDKTEHVDELARELDDSCRNSQDILPVVLAFKNSKHLQIGVSQLINERPVQAVHQSLTAVAESCIWKVTQNELTKLVEKHGVPSQQPSGDQAEFALLIGGRFGAVEPNYHSKASIWFCYEEDGTTLTSAGQRRISNQQFFGLLASRVGKVLSQSGVHGRLYELEKLPKSFGDATVAAVSVAAFQKMYSKNCDPTSAMFLSQCRIRSVSNDFANKMLDLLDRAVQICSADKDAWSNVWRDRMQLELNASRHNLKRGIGGTLDIETLVRFLIIANRSKLKTTDIYERQSNTVSALQLLIELQVVPEKEGTLLIRNFEWLKAIELCLRLLNLPRRHALPVEVPTEKSEDGQIENGEAGSVEVNTDDGMRIHQERLIALMGYDRFDAFCSDVESLLLENRATVTRVMELAGLTA